MEIIIPQIDLCDDVLKPVSSIRLNNADIKEDLAGEGWGILVISENVPRKLIYLPDQKLRTLPESIFLNVRDNVSVELWSGIVDDKNTFTKYALLFKN